jgi:DNA-binding response OmpR family regulator
MARILILEDEVDLAELYRMALEAAGHEVLGIFDDPERVLALRAKSLDPDVIVLDERLRGQSGMSFLPGLRGAFPRSRVMFASADPDAVEASLLKCADVSRKKPFPLSELVRDISLLLRSVAPLKKCEDPSR